MLNKIFSSKSLLLVSAQFLVTISLALTPCLADQTKKASPPVALSLPTTLYTYAPENVSFLLPAEWPPKEMKQTVGNYLVRMEADRPSSNNNNEHVTFVTKALSSNLPLDEFVNQHLKFISAELEGFKIEKTGNIKAAHSHGKYAIYTYKMLGTELRTVVFMFEKGKVGFALYGCSTALDFPQYRKLFMSIGKSLDLSKVKLTEAGALTSNPQSSAAVGAQSTGSRWTFNDPLYLDIEPQFGFATLGDVYFGIGIEGSVGIHIAGPVYLSGSVAYDDLLLDFMALSSGGSSSITETDLSGGFTFFLKGKTFLKDKNGQNLKDDNGEDLFIESEPAYISIEGGKSNLNQTISIGETYLGNEQDPMAVLKVGMVRQLGKIYFKGGLRDTFIFGSKLYDVLMWDIGISF